MEVSAAALAADADGAGAPATRRVSPGNFEVGKNGSAGRVESGAAVSATATLGWGLGRSVKTDPGVLLSDTLFVDDTPSATRVDVALRESTKNAATPPRNVQETSTIAGTTIDLRPLCVLLADAAASRELTTFVTLCP